VGGDPKTAVVALRGTATFIEWWDDLHRDLVPFAQVSHRGKVAQGFYGIYRTFGPPCWSACPGRYAHTLRTSAGGYRTQRMGPGRDPH